jgi:hypothetical protein
LMHQTSTQHWLAQKPAIAEPNSSQRSVHGAILGPDLEWRAIPGTAASIHG